MARVVVVVVLLLLLLLVLILTYLLSSKLSKLAHTGCFGHSVMMRFREVQRHSFD